MKLGILGTMVWDRIHARDVRRSPVEEWGGIAYALSAAAAARPEGWTLVPLVKVGGDLAQRARQFMAELPGLELPGGVLEVDAPNNRVELHYLDSQRRTERLEGGVPGWSWPELAPLVDELDALYINFISGFELDLATATRLRLGFTGPIYADLHSLLLAVAPDGQRVPRRLVAWREWLRCFDMVQVNEDELRWLAGAWGDPWRFAAEVVGDEVRLLLVTLGDRGVAYFAAPAFRPDPLSWHSGGLARSRPLGVPGAVRSERIAPPRSVADGDPTGCGDVWGATCCIELLRASELGVALEAANRAAARNAAHRGASGLLQHLQGRFTT